jgi:hypothetical protein
MGLPVPLAAGSAAETAAWIDSRIWAVVKGSIAAAAVFNKSRRSICVSFRPVVQIEPSLLIDDWQQAQRLIEFSIRQQPGVGGELASQNLQLQCTVAIDPQVPVLAVTHWVPLSLWHVDCKKTYISGVWRKLRATHGFFIWKIRG